MIFHMPIHTPGIGIINGRAGLPTHPKTNYALTQDCTPQQRWGCRNIGMNTATAVGMPQHRHEHRNNGGDAHRINFRA